MIFDSDYPADPCLLEEMLEGSGRKKTAAENVAEVLVYIKRIRCPETQRSSELFSAEGYNEDVNFALQEEH